MHKEFYGQMSHLRLVLRLNAASCLLFGLLFVVTPHSVARFLGDMPHSLLFALGIVLLGNGAHLIIASRRSALWTAEVIWFSLGDISWFLATLALIAAKLWITSAPGMLAASVVAIGVLGLGGAQLYLLRRHAEFGRGH